MRKIIVQEFITLDGVIQAPGGPGEDDDGGFKYGGWIAPFFENSDKQADDLMAKWLEPTDLLLGKRTYDIFASYWPKHAEAWPGIMDVTKYCVCEEDVKSDWQNSVFLKNVDDIKKLKETGDANLQVIGSGNLCQTLFKHNLVDELHLMIAPVMLGQGKRLFDEGTMPAAFKLTESLVASNGIIFANYKRDGEVKTGTVSD